MKFLVFVLGVVALTSALKTAEESKLIRSTCLASMSEDNKLAVRNFKYPKNDEIMNYVHCVAEGVESFGKNGFEYEIMSKIFKMPEDEMKLLVDECLKKFPYKDYTKHEELAYVQWLCLLENDKFKEKALTLSKAL
ncbi:Obp99c.2 family protein [Megaselia abdita]